MRAGLLGGLGAAFADAFRADHSHAATGDPVILGTVNSATGVTTVSSPGVTMHVTTGSPGQPAMRVSNTAANGNGFGLTIEAPGGGVAVRATGRVYLTDRSGIGVVKAGRRTMRVQRPVYDDTIGFASLMTPVRGLAIAAVWTDPREVGGIYVRLTAVAPIDVRIAWMLLN